MALEGDQLVEVVHVRSVQLPKVNFITVPWGT